MTARAGIHAWRVAATLLAGLGCASRSDSSIAVRRTTALLENSQLQHGRAGLLPAQVRGGEFGIIKAARISPDGRWVVVFDETAPFVKVVNDSGVASAIIPLRSDSTGRPVEPPVIAVSNRRVLMARPDLRRLELFDFAGRLQATFANLDFRAITATAISDSVWMIYGPSDARRGDTASWVHCLYLDGPAPRWTTAVFDRVESSPDMSVFLLGSINMSAPYVSGNEVVLEHRQPHRSSLVSVTCGDGRRDPVTSIQAYGFKSIDSLSRVPRAASKWYERTDGIIWSGVARLTSGLWTMSIDTTGSLLFQRVDARTPPTQIRVEGENRVMDSRAGLGLLLANTTRMPMLYLVPYGALDSALIAQR